ncbi:MAG TPA: tetratricopeptide repeat protein, partial [Thermoanaerobaculia bacterium]
RHIDVAPTILAAAGIPQPPALGGVSLVGPRGEKAPLSYFESYSTAYNRGWAPLRGVIGDHLKFIDLPVPELYDLERDPSESQNLFEARRDEARRLRASLASESAFASNARGTASPEEVAKLRSLGYLSGRAASKTTFTAEDDPKSLVSVDKEIHDSIDRYQRGDLSGAIAIARRILSERPTMEVAYENLGFLLRQTDSPSSALAVYKQAVDRGVAPEELYSAYGLALCESGHAAEAVRILAPFSESREPDTLNAYGVALADSGKAAEAIAVFDRVLSLDPEDVQAYTNIGIVRLRESDLQRAREAFQKGLAIDERFPRAWNGLGVVLARLGDERRAIECWSKAVELDPRLYDALFNLGLTAGKNGLRTEARRALERFVATAPPALYGPDIARARGLLRSLGSAS